MAAYAGHLIALLVSISGVVNIGSDARPHLAHTYADKPRLPRDAVVGFSGAE